MATVRLQLRRGLADDWFDANPTLAAGEIGIETDTNTFKFGDGDTPWNSLEYALSGTVDDYILLSTKGNANGVASLDSSGFVPASQLPPLAKVTVSAVADQAARLALTAEAGDIAIQADNGTTYVLSSSPASTNGNWREISATAAISAAVAAHEADTTSVHGIADTSLLATTANVATAKSEAISAAGTAADTKVSTAVAALTKSSVGLENVDNTSDANKPVSVATLAALGLKAPLESPALTGTATANNLTISGNLTVNGTTSTINSTTLTVQDKDIVLGQTSSPTDAGANGGGIVLKGTTDKSIKYDVAKSAWELSENINIPGDKAVKINNVEVLTISTVLGKSLPDVIVGTTETQTLSNKTLNSPVVDSPTFTGTMNLPLGTTIGNISSGELELLNGVTANVQTQIDAKAPSASPTFTGTVVLPSNTSIGNVSSHEIDLLNGVTANVQTQIDAKLESSTAASTYAPIASPTFTGTVVMPSTTSIGDVSGAELALLNGVTANVQTQIDAKAPLESPTFTGTVTLPANTISQSMMGDDSVGTNEIGGLAVTTAKIADSAITTDKIANDAVTTGKIAAGTIIDSDISASAAIAQSKIDGLVTALDLKAPLANPTFTGTVSGITKSMVGLANVDNTTDAGKPVSTATQTALDLKADLAGPTFTGTVVLPSTTSIGDVSATELGYLDGVTSSVQTQLTARLPLAGGTMTGALTLSADPSASLHAATKQYVDNTASGIVAKPQVLGATALNIDATYSNGTAGVGATLTHNTNGVFPADAGGASGWALYKGILVRSQTNKAQNGRYYISDMGSASTPYVLTRCGYCDEASEIPGAYIFVQDGTFAGTGWIQTVADPSTFVVGTDEINVFQFSGSGTITAGTGITVSGNEVSISTGAITSSLILDGTIVNGDINDSAAIAQSKISGLTAALGDKAPLASPTFTGTVTVAAAGVAFTDGTQTKQGVPSLTVIGTEISADYNLSTGGLALRDQLIPVAGTRAITVPTNATTAYPVGTSISFYQASGTGANFVPADVTVTILRTPGLKLRALHSSATITKVATNTWLLAGDLTA